MIWLLTVPPLVLLVGAVWLGRAGRGLRLGAPPAATDAAGRARAANVALDAALARLDARVRDGDTRPLDR